PRQAAGKAAKDTTEEVTVETSDGVSVRAWYYPLAEKAEPRGTVILIHDLGGSHRTVEPLAKALQAAGYAVVAPDLRGHGQSRLEHLPASQDDQSKLLKRSDFEMMSASAGGQKRDQSAVRGDIECVRNWIKQRADAGTLVMQPLFVVGSGLGATVAATWTAADANWRDLATGPQGREVAGLVLISPTFATKGYGIAPALAQEQVRKTVPVLVIAGSGERDATKVFDKLKTQRLREWFDSRHPPGDDKDASPVAADKASLSLLVHPAVASGDALATLRSADPRARAGDPANLLQGFLPLAASRKE
ncbi:MAG: alpha/beta hydrolase, partial [Pirellulales bacterium]